MYAKFSHGNVPNSNSTPCCQTVGHVLFCRIYRQEIIHYRTKESVPTKCIKYDFFSTLSSLKLPIIVYLVGGVNLNDITIEGRSRKEKLSETYLDIIWYEMFLIKDFHDQLSLPDVSTVVKFVHSIPHSNAEADRIFSVVRRAKMRT